MEVWLLNAAHMKAVPGRKTDVKDAEWIARLLEHGLLRPSFVPPPDIRRLRMLTRYRVQLMGDRTREITRLELMLEDASVKLSAVAASLTSVSARPQRPRAWLPVGRWCGRCAPARQRSERSTTVPAASTTSNPAASSRSTEELRLQFISTEPTPRNCPAGTAPPSSSVTVTR